MVKNDEDVWVANGTMHSASNEFVVDTERWTFDLNKLWEAPTDKVQTKLEDINAMDFWSWARWLSGQTLIIYNIEQHAALYGVSS